MNDIEASFKEYLEVFKQLPIPNKRQEIIHSVNEMTAIFEALASEANISLEYLKSDDILKLKNGTETEDEFLNALLVYVENTKSVIGEYLYKTIEE